MKQTGPIRMADAFKEATDDQDKIWLPEKTVARVKAKMQQLDLKIMENTVRIDNGRLDIPVFSAPAATMHARSSARKNRWAKERHPPRPRPAP
ncbi:hypothetical protein [Desulfosarcina cetonica]|uniref:hypothetical protein n=1 Tax=Desulfosarcina cetonica TaxID=90730 RepID=UPI00278BE0C2|nr:hypothetical protein [Desulfosarcina cetonica]